MLKYGASQPGVPTFELVPSFNTGLTHEAARAPPHSPGADYVAVLERLFRHRLQRPRNLAGLILIKQYAGSGPGSRFA